MSPITRFNKPLLLSADNKYLIMQNRPVHVYSLGFAFKRPGPTVPSWVPSTGRICNLVDNFFRALLVTTEQRRNSLCAWASKQQLRISTLSFFAESRQAA